MPKIINERLQYKRTITIEVVVDDWLELEREALRAREISYRGGITNGRVDDIIRISQEDGVVDRTGRYIPNVNLGMDKTNVRQPTK
jgi:hypothetical protein